MTLQMIMTHGGAQETFARHMPIWEALGCDIRVFCPTDDWPTNSFGHPVIGYGKAAHSGSEAMERFYHMLRWMEGAEKYDTFLVQEYDSFSLEMPEFISCSANWMFMKQPGWISEMCCHPPLAMTRGVLSDTIAAIGKLPFHAERGMWDRVMALAVKKEDVNFMGKYGFSRNTIEPEHYEDLRKAVAGGAKHYHGVKTKEVLDMIFPK